ncbi:MAG: prolyl oligopeptidase family protein [Candidatus Dormibacteria bacterium]
MNYPPTATVDQVDDYHGTTVADPYRWLEDLDSPETAAWVSRQNEVTFEYLETIEERESLRQRLTELWDYEKHGIPVRRGHRYFHQHNSGLQSQAVVYVSEGLEGPGRVLLDPNSLADDGTVALSGIEPSDDGSLLAYALSAAGSDWQEWLIRDVASGKDLDDHLVGVKFSEASWAADGTAIYYCGYGADAVGHDLEAANYNHRVYVHRVGTPQSEDVVVYERPDQPEWIFSAQVTDDGSFLVITASAGTETKCGIFLLDLTVPGARVGDLFTDFNAGWRFVDSDGSKLLFTTDLHAPNGRIVEVAAQAPGSPPHVRELVAETADALVAATVVGSRIFAQYLHDAKTVVRRFDLKGNPDGDVALPGVGTVAGFEGRREDTETFYAFTSFTAPGTIYRYDVPSGSSSVHREPVLTFDPGRFLTTQVFFTSKDGTQVPMFVSHLRGLPMEGTAPTYLYGYGGFNISLTPAFSPANIAWMERGGIYAVANIRGGGEYGEAWHEAAKRTRRQTAFDDFIAAAECLVERGYTSSAHLSIGGDSGGGLLVGACLTQRPELFGAARIGVGVLDILRFHKFTIGWAWKSDFGDPDDPEEFQAIHAYSPLHNIRPGTRYPATLVTTADHDDRVVPSHSFKFTAALQAAQAGPAPILARIDVRAGHGAGKPTAKVIEATADSWAFLLHELGGTQR